MRLGLSLLKASDVVDTTSSLYRHLTWQFCKKIFQQNLHLLINSRGFRKSDISDIFVQNLHWGVLHKQSCLQWHSNSPHWPSLLYKSDAYPTVLSSHVLNRRSLNFIFCIISRFNRAWLINKFYTRKHSSRMHTDHAIRRPSSEPVAVRPIVDRHTPVKTLLSLAVSNNPDLWYGLEFDRFARQRCENPHGLQCMWTFYIIYWLVVTTKARQISTIG